MAHNPQPRPNLRRVETGLLVMALAFSLAAFIAAPHPALAASTLLILVRIVSRA